MPEPSDLERRATALLQRLIRFDTTNPPGGERAAQEHLKQILERAGFECELLGVLESRPNLVARLTARSDGPRLCYLGHIDTVRADPAEWSVDPWAGDQRESCVWGRGALDMKGQVAAEVTAVSALAEEGWRPASGELLIVITVDEEVAGLYGAMWLCGAMPEKVRCDMVVNEGAGAVFQLDGRRFHGVSVAEKGVFRFTLATAGRAGHASIPGIGENALGKMAPLLKAISERRPPLEPSPEGDALLRALGREPGDDLAAAFRSLACDDPALARLLEPTFRVTLSPTMIRASEQINVIPSGAELQVDCRAPPDFDQQGALERIVEVLGDDDAYELHFDLAGAGNRSPADTLLMEHIGNLVAREDPDATVIPTVLPWGSDSRWFREAFPDAVAYGFFPQRTMSLLESVPLIHGVDERVPVEDMGLATRFYSQLAEVLLG